MKSEEVCGMSGMRAWPGSRSRHLDSALHVIVAIAARTTETKEKEMGKVKADLPMNTPPVVSPQELRVQLVRDGKIGVEVERLTEGRRQWLVCGLQFRQEICRGSARRVVGSGDGIRQPDAD
jgi:hypothetical protein